MSKCFLKLDTRRALKDRTYPVKIAVSYGTNLYLNTEVSVLDTEWDPQERKVTGPRAKRLNDVLSSALVRVSNRVLTLRESGKFYKMSGEQLKKALTAIDPDAVEEESTPKPNLLQIARMCLQTKDAENTRKSYALTISKVEAFLPFPDEFYIEDMTRTWLHDFQVSLGGKVNSQAIHLRNLRHICNFALDEELTTFYPFRKFHIKTEETQKKALTIEQLRALKNLTGLTEFQAEHRDVFLLQFYLRGINIGDLAKMTRENISQGRIDYRRSKTGRLFSVKIEPEMEAIIEAHRGEQHLLAPFDRYTSYKDYLHHLNDCLKKLSDGSGPIEKGLSTNWARHTWATLCAELDIPDPTITLGMGHTTAGHKTTAIYIKRDMAKVDEANRKVIDYLWAE